MILIEAKVVDATHLQLSRPITVKRGRSVYISMAETEATDDDQQPWLAASASSLQSAYVDSEPDYASSLVKEPNADYQA